MTSHTGEFKVKIFDFLGLMTVVSIVVRMRLSHLAAVTRNTVWLTAGRSRADWRVPARPLSVAAGDEARAVDAQCGGHGGTPDEL